MARPLDRDLELESLNTDLRAAMQALNEECHPVETPREDRVAALEQRIANLKDEIKARRAVIADDRPLKFNRRDADA